MTPADNAYALTALNAMRAAEAPGAVPFVRVAALDTYATASNDKFIADGAPHSCFIATSILPSCPGPIAPLGPPAAGENEGVVGPGTTNIAAIDLILAFFLSERDAFPPGHASRGHYEAIINPVLNHVGIAAARAPDGRFVMTQDFCD